MLADSEEVDYPCPACGARLFGWTAAHDPLRSGKQIVLDRCESCELVVTRAAETPDPEAELEVLLDETGDGLIRLVAPNRSSVQASIGGAQWADLEPELRRLHLTPEATRRLLERRGLEIVNLATPFSERSHAAMRQTMINAFTLRDNFLRNERVGLLGEPTTTRERMLRWLDYAVSYLVWVPSAIVAWPLERLAARLGRGGMLEVTAQRTGSERD